MQTYGNFLGCYFKVTKILPQIIYTVQHLKLLQPVSPPPEQFACTPR